MFGCRMDTLLNGQVQWISHNGFPAGRLLRLLRLTDVKEFKGPDGLFNFAYISRLLRPTLNLCPPQAALTASSNLITPHSIIIHLLSCFHSTFLLFSHVIKSLTAKQNALLWLIRLFDEIELSSGCFYTEVILFLCLLLLKLMSSRPWTLFFFLFWSNVIRQHQAPVITLGSRASSCLRPATSILEQNEDALALLLFKATWLHRSANAASQLCACISGEKNWGWEDGNGWLNVSAALCSSMCLCYWVLAYGSVHVRVSCSVWLYPDLGP